MGFRLPRALALLLLLVPTSAARPAPAGEKELRGKRYSLHEAPRSQLASGHPVHPVGPEIRIGKAVFPVAAEKGKTRVAPTPDAPPSAEVAPGKAVRLSWTEGEGKREISVTFGKGEEDAWTWWASEAVRYQVAGEEFRLYDADGDGRFGDVGKDGWSAGGSDQVLPLTREFLLGSAAVTLLSVDPDGGRIVFESAPVAGSKSQLAALLGVNRLRTAHGLLPAALDGKLSAACTSHALYLSGNGWTGRTNPHDQNLGPKGASPEGAAAAARSAISSAPPDVAVQGFWRTFYHRIALMGPALDRIGVNEAPPDLAVIDVARGYGVGVGVAGAGEAREPKGGAWPWTDPVFVPADGSAGNPAAASGELPKEPVPDLGSRGLPLMAVFRATTKVQGFVGALVEIRGGAETRVPVLPADPGDFGFAFGIVPEKPLRSRAAYRATFTWKSEGRECRRTIRFRTE